MNRKTKNNYELEIHITNACFFSHEQEKGEFAGDITPSWVDSNLFQPTI